MAQLVVVRIRTPARRADLKPAPVASLAKGVPPISGLSFMSTTEGASSASVGRAGG